MRKMKFVNKETIGDFLQGESRLVEWGGSCQQGPGWVTDQRNVKKVRPAIQRPNDRHTYRVVHLVADLGWVDLDFCVHHLAYSPSPFCQIPISQDRVWQTVEHSKSKYTQPRFATRWVTLY